MTATTMMATAMKTWRTNGILLRNRQIHGKFKSYHFQKTCLWPSRLWPSRSLFVAVMFVAVIVKPIGTLTSTHGYRHVTNSPPTHYELTDIDEVQREMNSMIVTKRSVGLMRTKQHCTELTTSRVASAVNKAAHTTDLASGKNSSQCLMSWNTNHHTYHDDIIIPLWLCFCQTIMSAIILNP